MRDALEAVAQTVREIIGRVDLPFRPRPEMGVLVLGDPVRGDVPHLGVGVLYVLLHAQPGRLGRVLAVSHAPELLEIGLDVLLCVLASISRAGPVLAAALQLGLGLVAVAHVGPL